MTAVALLTTRNRWCAAKRRQPSSSVAPVAAGYERSLRPSLACFSRPAVTICEKGDR
jgi:hypothetical protein